MLLKLEINENYTNSCFYIFAVIYKKPIISTHLMYDPLPSLYPVEVRKRQLESAWISWAVTSQVEETYSNIYIRPNFEKRTKKKLSDIVFKINSTRNV